MLIKHRTPSPSENAGRVATELRNISNNNRKAICANIRGFMPSGSKSSIVRGHTAAILLWPDYLISNQLAIALRAHGINWNRCKKW